MLKVLMMTAITAAALAACAQQNEPESPVVGMANPAAEFCVKQGGKSVIKKDARDNEYGECHLPDGSVVEEWAYFRQHHQ